MKKKSIICIAVASAVLAGVGFSGCMATNNPADLKQVIATVNVAESSAFKEEFGDYASAICEQVFYKSDMMAAYASSYQYVDSSDLSSTLESIKDALVTNAVVTQYATASLLKIKDADTESGVKLSEYKQKETEVDKYEYLLGGEESDGVKKARYTLNSSLNSSLDSLEKNFVKEKEGEDYVGSGTRSTPANIDSLDEDYIPEHYDVYTGYAGYLITDTEIAAAIENGDYEQVENGDRVTRQQAYSEFIKSLERNYLISEEDDDTNNVKELSYYKRAYVSQLQQAIVDEYNEEFTKVQENKITKVEDGKYAYIENQYSGTSDGLLTSQEKTYSKASAFESAMDEISDTKFILCSPDTTGDTKEVDGVHGTYGYVYNILLPFSTAQSNLLTTLQSYRDEKTIDDIEYFKMRNVLLKNITTTDQRSAWFNGATDYSFDASSTGLDYFGKSANRNYLFFENNVTKTDKYQALDKYCGLYSYNGSVTKNKDGSYKLVPKELDIDGMLKEFSDYINYVLGASGSASYTINRGYYDIPDSDYKADGDKEIDYSKLVYATGKVRFTDDKDSKNDMFVTDTARYKAMAAVNELQYAYTTDTSVLSQYIGYSVSAYDTSYIKEFEYAAQKALREGVGTFKVCAGDYGWHLIYVTDAFSCEGGEAYSPDWTVASDRINCEGTFEYKFYNWLKDSTLSTETSLKKESIIKQYNTDEAVKVYKNAYKDLLGAN